MDEPTGAELLGTVARYLRETLLPKLPPEAVFHTRVAANAVDLVRRQLELGAGLETEELARLRALLGREGSLDELNRALSERISAGELGERTPGLMEHLWATTLAKMAVDQPAYASYRRELELRQGEGAEPSGG
ncbi:DUF6285 domain-containing protein [Quisquiliibacterium transsilvanicum]|uniref:DUF6285 domain-containing protein n=1 Tax=Quisquiliibacterium transsilvanicum TaxID=1549638 RepID=A0A7W8HE04_9BURK|nr:DUF6285 domain-containing protein [Quisquiliibacterium transsilvanicum]MBB5270309.1 hypothetical protein [Quisquiliibacterium transsilvanicum]